MNSIDSLDVVLVAGHAFSGAIINLLGARGSINLETMSALCAKVETCVSQAYSKGPLTEECDQFFIENSVERINEINADCQWDHAKPALIWGALYGTIGGLAALYTLRSVYKTRQD